MKSLSNLAERQKISARLSALSPADTARWGIMSVHQMVCHLDDSYKCALGERQASSSSSLLQRTLVKQFALKVPLRWPKGVPTRPEVEQGRGGTPPLDFQQDLISLLATLARFCETAPCSTHPIFGAMTAKDWMRWGYLHADHHLRQFGR